eukprot:m.41538 g.41538  ORF g.41538 m.41538 type:complete len:69 (+) comp6146_c0_seq1:319-525(+)
MYTLTNGHPQGPDDQMDVVHFDIDILFTTPEVHADPGAARYNLPSEGAGDCSLTAPESPACEKRAYSG